MPSSVVTKFADFLQSVVNMTEEDQQQLITYLSQSPGLVKVEEKEDCDSKLHEVINPNSELTPQQVHFPHQDHIFVDGANSGSTGGWAVVFDDIHLSGQVFDTTNNRMELQAAIEALKLLHSLPYSELGGIHFIYSDSQYVVKGITQWIYGWMKSDWKDGTIKNQDLWKQLHNLLIPGLEWVWVKGHSGIKGNEIADQLAFKAARKKS
jgi:ribonuclease HI